MRDVEDILSDLRSLGGIDTKLSAFFAALKSAREEDLGTIEALFEAGTPVRVLLSKADILSPADRQSARDYIVEQIRLHLNLSLDVHPVSIVGRCAALLDNWFDGQIAPLYAQHQRLALESVERKIGALRESVRAALRSRLNRPEGAVNNVENLRETELKLRRAAGLIPEALSCCPQTIDEIRGLAPAAFQLAATRVVDNWLVKEDGESAVISAAFGDVVGNSAQKVYLVLEHLAEELAGALQEVAGALSLPEPLQEEDLVSVLRKMPQLDLGTVMAPVRRSRFVRVASPLIRARVESKLRDAFGDTVSDAFQSYRRSLETWLRAAVARMQARFDAEADTYRAQLDRLIRSSSITADGGASIRRDLDDLGHG